MESQQLQKLVSELQNGNARQRRAAAYKLSKSKDTEAAPALIKAYNDMDSTVRQDVIDGLNNIGSKEALDFLSSQGVPLAVRDPFLIIRARATRAGAWAGLVGAVVGEVVLMVVLASIGAITGTGPPLGSYFILLLILLVCPPYPLLGAAIGALIGPLSAKRVGNIENDTAVFRLATVGGGIAGFVIGVISPIVVNGLLYLAFYSFAWLVALS